MTARTHLRALSDEFGKAGGLPQGMSFTVEERPSFGKFLADMQRISANTGDDWHLRFYSAEIIQAIEAGRVYRQYIGNREAGCIYVIDRSPELSAFGQTGDVELFKVGLYPEYVGKGIGQYLLRHVMWAESQRGARGFYLNTRRSNRVESGPFYGRNGFHVVGVDQIGQTVETPVLAAE